MSGGWPSARAGGAPPPTVGPAAVGAAAPGPMVGAKSPAPILVVCTSKCLRPVVAASTPSRGFDALVLLLPGELGLEVDFGFRPDSSGVAGNPVAAGSPEASPQRGHTPAEAGNSAPQRPHRMTELEAVIFDHSILEALSIVFNEPAIGHEPWEGRLCGRSVNLSGSRGRGIRD
jgi:hypothetical protein